MTVLHGHVLEQLASIDAQTVDCVVSSPPYWQMRQYPIPDVDWPEVSYQPMPGVDHEVVVAPWAGQLGAETQPREFIGHLVLIFRELARVLREDGTCWINIGDTYASGGFGGGGAFNELRRSKGWSARKKQGHRSAPEGYQAGAIAMIPEQLALALHAEGWVIRSRIVWHKPNCFPGARVDRPTVAHEHVWMLTRIASGYHYDRDEATEPAKRNDPRVRDDKRAIRDVWSMSVARPGRNESSAPMPERLAERCIRIGCPVGGVVLDPFSGGGHHMGGRIASGEGLHRCRTRPRDGQVRRRSPSRRRAVASGGW